MRYPGMSPMIHAVHALCVIDEFTALGKSPKRTRLLSTSQYGDVRNMPSPHCGSMIPIPMDQLITIAYVVPNGEAEAPASRILERFVEPASRELARMILDHDANYRCFARMDLPPDNFADAFRADHNDLSVLCTMAYDMDEGGVKCQLALLYGHLDT